MKNQGKILIASLICVTLGLWLLAKPEIGDIFQKPTQSLGQILGLWGATLISLNFLLASRARYLENIFGGLDKVYRAHRWVGVWAFLTMVYHPISLAWNFLSFRQVFRQYFLISGDLANSAGVLAIYSFVILIALSLMKRLSYPSWKALHLFMALPLFLVFVHVALVSSDVSRFAPLRFWILGLLLLACASYIYRRVVYGRFAHRRLPYRILQANLRGPIMELRLAPASGRFLQFLPGQFVFLSLPALGTREDHPFSVSSGPGADLRLSVKALGDFTRAMRTSQPGEEAWVTGPYGAFGERALESGQAQIWIAGGIGVTPFLSLLHYRAERAGGPEATFFYSARNRAEAAYLEEILAASEKNPKIKVIPRFTDEDGQLTADGIREAAGKLSDKLILLCGPAGMVRSFSENLALLGAKRRNLISEDFSFRE